MIIYRGESILKSFANIINGTVGTPGPEPGDTFHT